MRPPPPSRRAWPLAGAQPSARDVEQYFASLHLSDLALATACIDGHEAAWEHFVLEYRPALYRAADAIDPGGEHHRGAISFSPSIDDMERAYDDAKYGHFSKKPYIDMIIPTLVDPTMAPIVFAA